MKYRNFGKLDWKGSALGFGAMRLPVSGKKAAPMGPDIDRPETIRMIRYAIDNGVNYVDTAYPYHAGNSEKVVGEALQDGYRDKVKLATKMPSWFMTKFEDFDKYLNEQLEKLKTDHIDFYLLHSMNKMLWPKLLDLDVFKWARGAIADGRIGHLGFSFHDSPDLFKEIVDAYDWTFCQIQYNYMDTDYQAGTEGLKYAADRGLAVVIMEPLRGGALSKEPPPSVHRIYADAAITRSPADLALQWLWDQPEVSVVLSGMTEMSHVVENVASAKASGSGVLAEKEQAAVSLIREEYLRIRPIPCTDCGYCMPCSSGVDIPHVFAKYNDAFIYDDPRTARFRYRQIPKENWADKCVDCEECVEKCPQEILINEWLKKVHEYLGPKKTT
ncbi:MAG: aldo/keto reductase [Desulfobacterales bacterium]